MIPSRRAMVGGLGAWAAMAGFARSTPAFDAAKAYSRERRGVSFLVMDATGAVLGEDYPNDGAPERAWELASGTKSFCGIAAAAGVQDGLFALDRPCADVLPEWRGDARRTITLRHLLTLTSGLQGGPLGRPPPYSEAVATMPSTAPGARFAYGPTPFQVFGEMLRRASGEDVLTYYQRRVFDPIGVRPQRWRRGGDGNPHLPSGAALTARDWAKFGVMTLNGWRKDGRALVDPATLAANFDPSRANPGYGLTWWLLRPGLIGPSPRSGVNEEAIGPLGVAEDIVMAAGAGNQRLYLLRKRKLVVVRQASGVLRALRGRAPQWSDADFLRALLTSI